MAKLRLLLPLLLVAVAAACAPPKRMPNAAYYLGESFLRRGQIDQSIEAYQVFISDPGPNPDLYLPRAYYMLAFAYYRQKRFDEAMSTLDELERRYPSNDSVQVWALRGDVSRELGRRVQAVQEYDEAWRFAGQLDRVRLESRVVKTLKEMTPEELAQAEQLVSDPLLHDEVSKQLVASGGSVLAAEDNAAIADNDAALAAAPVGTEPILRAEERQAALEEENARRRERLRTGEETELDREAAKGYGEPLPPVEPPPLAEAEQPLAEEVPPAVAPEPIPRGPAKIVCLAPLTGADATAGQKVCNSVTNAFGDSAERVLSQDAGETPNAARAAWMTAIEDPSVVAAVAWLPSEATQAVTPMAETAGVPTILLSGGAGADGRYVRKWGPGRAQEVNTLADYMMNTVRVRRFGVLYPDTEAGNDYLDRFSAAVRAGGASIVGKQFYRSGKLDWNGEMETIKKWRSRDANVDAVFVPDQLANVSDLVAAINQRYPDLIVLGLSSWSASSAPLQAFIAGGGTDTAAFDAGSALYGAIIGGGADSRYAVEERLRNVDGAATASTAPPTIFRLQDGNVEQVGG